ncbi:DUF4386 domain-containing protein [Sulfurovum sp.]|uniref:DUF4386 domain-containing protein n=1 Tax=Sulfurovum sp. TaxID=1969726 RepID=UPI003568DA99
MKNNIKTARIVGALFIVATVAYTFGVVLLDPFLYGSHYLTTVSANENILIIGAFLVLIDAVAVAGIAIAIYPILKKHNEALALGYVGARIGESVLFSVNVIATLTLLTLSQEFVKAGSPDASYYQTLGTVLLAAGNWAYLLGLGLVFALSALILNFVLYQSKLVPRWLSAWGFIGAALVFANFLVESFGMKPVEILFIPIAVQEMAFAVWLIIKGFNSPATISVATKTDVNEA